MSSDRSEGGSDSLHDCLLGKSDMTERQEASGRGILAVNVWFLWCCGKIIQQHNTDMLLPEPCPVETSGCRAEIKDWSVGGSLDVHLLKTSCRQVPAVVMVSVLLSQDAVCPGSSHTHHPVPSCPHSFWSSSLGSPCDFLLWNERHNVAISPESACE